ncbi:MAG: hypothetical protein HC853_11895 [Anaerolineae bacterium]|nr:hypothetical protein [Anaerolineae bacterium]
MEQQNCAAAAHIARRCGSPVHPSPLHPLTQSPTAPAIDASTDADNDGLPSDIEEGLGTAKDKADTDGDGLNDGVEALKLGLSGTSADSDSDDLPDLSEVRAGATRRAGSGTPTRPTPTPMAMACWTAWNAQTAPATTRRNGRYAPTLRATAHPMCLTPTATATA